MGLPPVGWREARRVSSGLFSFPLGKGPSGEAGLSGRFQGRDGDGPPVNPYSFEQADVLNLLLSLFLRDTPSPKEQGALRVPCSLSEWGQRSFWECCLSWCPGPFLSKESLYYTELPQAGITLLFSGLCCRSAVS